MIKFRNVSKYHMTKQGRYYVLKDVTIDLPTDRSIAVLGPNGAGKSTLVRMIGGADYPSKGTISSKRRISWPLSLKGSLQGAMTGRENVRFVTRINGERNTKIAEDQVAEFAQIGRYFDEPVKTYSSGMKAKVSFGLAMAVDLSFEVLLIDELRAVGDANFKKKSKALLADKLSKTKLIMVSHSMKELKYFCQAGVVIKDKSLHYYEDINMAIKDYRETYNA